MIAKLSNSELLDKAVAGDSGVLTPHSEVVMGSHVLALFDEY